MTKMTHTPPSEALTHSQTDLKATDCADAGNKKRPLPCDAIL